MASGPRILNHKAMKITIIGAGNMGGAIARGLAKGSLVNVEDITVSDPNEKCLDALVHECPGMKVMSDNREAVKDADMVLLAVKPWLVQPVIDDMKDALDYNRIIFASIAAGVGTEQLCKYLDREDGEMPPVYYLIPNTAIAVMSGMTFITSVFSTPENDAKVLALFDELGKAMLVEERLIGPCMALASCGIAYVMRYIRAATEGGVELGLYARDAQTIVMQTMKGAVDLLAATGNHPEAEIDKVTTPGGLTIRGLNAMEEAGFTNSVIKGLKASIK